MKSLCMEAGRPVLRIVDGMTPNRGGSQFGSIKACQRSARSTFEQKPPKLWISG